MTRRLTLVVSLILCFLAGGPAAGQKAVTVEITNLKKNAVLSGDASISAVASSATGIERLDISINRIVLAKKEPSGFQQEVALTAPWDTATKAASGAPAANGEYRVLATATAVGGAGDHDEVSVIVDNPPAVPSGLSATADVDEVFLAWSPNPEPDILAYTIERDSGKGFIELAETETTSYTDAVRPGVYAYRVVAHRYSALSDEGIKRRSEPVSVTVTRPSAPAGGGSAQTDDAGKSRGGLRVSGKEIAGSGLPAGAELAGGSGLPSAPAMTGDAGLEWGTYEEELPVELPDGGVPLAGQSAARSPWRIIPPDGLRWVAGGLLLIVTAGLLYVSAVRVDVAAGVVRPPGRDRPGGWAQRFEGARRGMTRLLRRSNGRHLARLPERSAGSRRKTEIRELGRKVSPWLRSSTKGKGSPTSRKGAAPRLPIDPSS